MENWQNMHMQPDFSVAQAPRAINFGAKRAISAMLAAALVYVFFMLFAAVLAKALVADEICLAVIHAGGALALLIFWRMGHWGRAKYDSFGAALLLMGAAFRVQALIDALAYGTRMEDIYRYGTVPVTGPDIDLLMKGELITVLGMLLVACSWRLAIGSRIEQYSFLLNAKQLPKRLPILVYLVAIGIAVLRVILKVKFGALDQIASLLYSFGVASIYFIANHQHGSLRKVIISSLLALPMAYLAMGSGMKEEIFFPFIPAVFIYWRNYRNFGARALAIALGVAVLSLSQLYVHYVRAETWRSTDTKLSMSTSDLVSGFGGQLGGATAGDALDQMSSRINMTIAHATSVTLADHHGFEPFNIFGPIPASLIPRMLWTGKPIMQPGAMQTYRILGGRVPLSQIGSATAAGFSTELYLGGWWIGLVLGACVFGSLMAGAQRWSLGFASGFGHQSLCFIVMYWTLRFDETHVVYAFTTVIFTVIFILILTKSSKMLGFR